MHDWRLLHSLTELHNVLTSPSWGYTREKEKGQRTAEATCAQRAAGMDVRGKARWVQHKHLRTAALIWNHCESYRSTGKVPMPHPVLIHHDQRQCQEVLGQQSPGQHPSLRSPRSRALASVSPWALWGPDLEKQTAAHTTLHLAVREDLQSRTKPWWDTYLSCCSVHTRIHSLRAASPDTQGIGTSVLWGPTAWGEAKQNRSCSSFSVQPYILADPAC